MNTQQCQKFETLCIIYNCSLNHFLAFFFFKTANILLKILSIYNVFHLQLGKILFKFKGKN
jgi:hypothetical protein